MSKICDIDQNVRTELKQFRFNKSTSNRALILKIDKEKQLVIVDELIEDVSVEELQDQLPGHQPRFVIYSYKMQHADRVSFPMCFIFFSPRDSQIELQVLYAGMLKNLQKEADLNRMYEIRDIEDFTEEWLKEKLK